MQGSNSPSKKALPSHSRGPHPSTYPVADKVHCAACLVAFGIEPHVPQHDQDVHGRIPPAVPRRTAPPPVVQLEGKRLGASTFGSNPRALATSSADAPIRSRNTCQRIGASESTSHWMTGVCVLELTA